MANIKTTDLTAVSTIAEMVGNAATTPGGPLRTTRIPFASFAAQLAKATGAEYPSIVINDYLESSDARNIQRVWDLLVAGGARNIILKDDGLGTFYANRLDMPDDGAAGNDRTIEKPGFKFTGVKKPTITQAVDGQPYLIGHPSFKGTTTRGRNFYHSIENMTLLGRGTMADETWAIALSNNHRGRIKDVTWGGFPRGGGLYIWAHRNGGSFQNEVTGCCTVDIGVSGSWNGDGLYEEANIIARGIGYAVRIDGPTDGPGKANDHTFIRNYFQGCRYGAYSTEGHGGTIGSSGTAYGGSDNLTIIADFISMDETYRQETGVLDGANSTTVIRLSSTPGSFINNTNGVYNDHAIEIIIDSVTSHFSWIDSFVVSGSDRLATLATPLPIAPASAAGLSYRISNGDSYIRAKFPNNPNGLQHFIYWESADFEAKVIASRLERGRLLLAHQNSNSRVNFIAMYDVVDSDNHPIRVGPDPYWGPRASFFTRPRGSDDAPNYTWTPGINLTNPEFTNYYVGIYLLYINQTGATIDIGSIVSENDHESIANSVDYTTFPAGGYPRHFVVSSPSRLIFLNGRRTQCMVKGKAEVLISGTGKRGDLVLPTTGNVGVCVTENSTTPAYIVKRAVAILSEDKSTGGVGKAWATII